ncbi:MAG: hypothetical protein QXT92_00380 [Nitrososphaerota archaeon]
MPSITGGVVLTGARIMLPIDAATARSSFYVPLVSTISYIGSVGGTVKVSIPEPVEAVLDVVSTIGTITSGKIVASISSGVLDRVGTIMSGNLAASITGGVLDNLRYVGTVGTVMSGRFTASITSGILDYIGTIKHVFSVSTIGTIPLKIDYLQIIASLGPKSEYISNSFDSSYFPGGIGFSISYIAGENVSATIFYQNSYDNITFKTVGSVAIPNNCQDDRVFSPTRPYWRFVAINPSAFSATIDAVISLMPPGA